MLFLFIFLILSLSTDQIFAAPTIPYPTGSNIQWNPIVPRFQKILNSSCDTIMGATGGVVTGFSNDGTPACEKFENLVTPPPPTLTLQANDNDGNRLDNDPSRVIQSGETFTITWNPQYVRSCSVSWDASSLGPNSSSLLRVKSSMSIIAPSVTTNTSQTYTMSCVWLDGTNTGDQTIRVEMIPWPPSLTFEASATQIFSGQTVTLTWTGTNLSSCSWITWNGSNISWSVNSTGGTYSSSPLRSSAYFTLSCTSLQGDSIVRSTPQIEVIHPTTPTILLGMTWSTTSTEMNLWESRTLVWMVSNADTCEASGGWWSGSKQSIWMEQVTPDKRMDYILECFHTQRIGSETRTVSSRAYVSLYIRTQLSVTMQTSAGWDKIMSGQPIQVSLLANGMKSCTTTLNETTGNSSSDTHIFYTATGWFMPQDKYPNFTVNPEWIQPSWDWQTKRGQIYTYTFTCIDVNNVSHSVAKYVYVFLRPTIEVAIRVANYHSFVWLSDKNWFVDNAWVTALPWTTLSGGIIFGKDWSLWKNELTNTSNTQNTKVYVWWLSDRLDDKSLVCNGVNTGMWVFEFNPTWPINPDPKEIIHTFNCYQIADDNTTFPLQLGDSSVRINISANHVCWDGTVGWAETCDDGLQNGVAGSCNSSCTGIAVAAACGARIWNIGSGRSATATSVGNCAEGNTVQDFSIVNDQVNYRSYDWYCVGSDISAGRVHCSAYSVDDIYIPPPTNSTPLRDTCRRGEFRAPSGRLCITVNSSGDAWGAGGASTTTSSFANPFH